MSTAELVLLMLGLFSFGMMGMLAFIGWVER